MSFFITNIHIKQEMNTYSLDQKFTAKQYIELFNSLGKSKQANIQLLRLVEKSQNLWQIAKDLIMIPQYYNHGCSLLSDRLKKPYTQNDQAQHNITGFILSLPQLNHTLIFCLAKIALHLKWQSLDLGPHMNPQNLILLLKSIIQASQIINLRIEAKANQDNERSRTRYLFNKYKEFLIQYFSTYPTEIIECLQSYLEANFKIQSEEILKLLLTRPLEQISSILEDILLGEKYENLNNQIFAYLNEQSNFSNPSSFFVVYIAFTRTLNLLQIPYETLKGILQKILKALHYEAYLDVPQQKQCNFTSDSHQLWSDLSQKLKSAISNQISTPQVQLCLEAFVTLWQTVIRRCLLIQVPNQLQKSQGRSLDIIDLCDDDDQENIEQIYQKEDINKSRFKFRDSEGGQLISQIFQTVQKRGDISKKCLYFLASLLESEDIIKIEVSLFTLSNFVDMCNSNSAQQIHNLLRLITQSPVTQNIYIRQQLIELLGKLGHELIWDQRIFRILLIQLHKSMSIKEFSNIACETFSQILQTCNNSSEKQAQTPLLEDFFSFLYKDVYFQTDNKQMFNTITKSIIYFIYHFQPDENSFQLFLVQVLEKINRTQNDQDKCQIIQCLAMSHIFIENQRSRMFTPIISQFFVNLFPIFISYINKCPSKKVGSVVKQLQLTIKVGGGYNTSKWIENLTQLSNLKAIMNDRSLIINLFNKLMVVDQFDEKYCKDIIQLAQAAEKFVTQSLLEAGEDSYKVINKSLTFHFTILTKFIGDQVFQNYNPSKLLVFITQKIFTGFLKYELESTRTSLSIIRFLITKNYLVQELLLQCLKVFPKIVDMLWRLLDDILFQAYKIGGQDLYIMVFVKYHPPMLPPNPLFSVLMQGICEKNSKIVHKILTGIK